MTLAPTVRQSARSQACPPIPTAAISRFVHAAESNGGAEPWAHPSHGIGGVTALHQLPNPVESKGRMAPMNTYYNCDNAQFSLTKCQNGVDMEDDWQPAKVTVTEIGDNHRWLFVANMVDEGSPVVFRAIKEGWEVHCDENALTMSMRKVGSNTEPLATVQKLRFGTHRDFWGFITQIATSRVRAYTLSPHPDHIHAQMAAFSFHGENARQGQTS